MNTFSLSFLLVLGSLAVFLVPAAADQVDLDVLREYLQQRALNQRSPTSYVDNVPADVQQQRQGDVSPDSSDDSYEPDRAGQNPQQYDEIAAHELARNWEEPQQADGFMAAELAQQRNWEKPQRVVEYADAEVEQQNWQDSPSETELMRDSPPQEPAWNENANSQRYFDPSYVAREYEEEREQMDQDEAANDDAILAMAEVRGVEEDDDDEDDSLEVNLRASKTRKNSTVWGRLSPQKVVLSARYERFGGEWRVFGVVVTLADNKSRFLIRKDTNPEVGRGRRYSRTRVFKANYMSNSWKLISIPKMITKSTFGDFVAACKKGRSAFESTVLMMERD